MPVDDIDKVSSLVPAVLQGRTQTFAPFAFSLLGIVKNPVAVALAAKQNLPPTQQSVLLGSEALHILNRGPTAQADPLLAAGTTSDVTASLESQGLSPAQQGALVTNETVQNFLDTQDLTPARQAALMVEQTAQVLAAPLAPPKTAIPVATAVVPAQNPPAGAVGTTSASETAAVVEAARATLAAAAATSTQRQPSATDTNVGREVLSPSSPATAQPISYKNAFAVYEFRTPPAEPSEPKPIRQEVHPVLQIGRVRPVAPLVLKQEWEKRSKTIRQESAFQEDNSASRPALAEKSIQQMIVQANEDLVASEVPLHLVLSKKEEAFVLNIYDSSGNDVCQVVQEVPVDLNNLLTLLDNLEHEAGIIVNIQT